MNQPSSHSKVNDPDCRTDFVTHWGDQHYPLANLTETDVVAKLSSFAAAAGVVESVFYHGMTNRSTAGGTNPWAVAREA